MKLIALVFFIGFVSASPIYEDAVKEDYHDAMVDMKEAPSYEYVLGFEEHNVFADEEFLQLDFSMKNLFRELKKELLGKNDNEKLKSIIEQLFGKGTEMANAFEDFINNKSDEDMKDLLDFIDEFLDENEQQMIYEQRGFKKLWKKVKKIFKNVKDITKKLKKFTKLGKWIKAVFKNGFDKRKSKLENIKNIALEFLKRSNGISIGVACEALEFLKEYRKDLGSIYDQVRETVKIIQNRKY